MKFQYNDKVRVKYMKSSYICDYIGEYIKDGYHIVEVLFRGNIYVFDKDTITLELYDGEVIQGKDADI